MKFKIGDLCITQNSRVPLLNDNHLVVVISIHPGKTCSMGERIPYLVKRIDGQPHGATKSVIDNGSNWRAHAEAFCPEHMLRRRRDTAEINLRKSKIKAKRQSALMCSQ